MADGCVCGLPASNHLTDDEIFSYLGHSAEVVLLCAGKDLTIEQLRLCMMPRMPTGCPQNHLRDWIFRRLNRAGCSINGRAFS